MKFTLVSARILGILLAVLTVILDQGTKYAFIRMAKSGSFPLVIEPFFSLVMVWNSGVSFGMFSHHALWMPLILTCVTSLIVVFLLIWLIRSVELFVVLALGLIIGGAVGNIIDRLHFGSVADFFDFHIGSAHWPAFNIADSAIFIGVVTLVFHQYNKPHQQNGQENSQ